MLHASNGTAMEPFLQEILPELIQTSVGPKETTSEGIQPCITYNPPGSFLPGLTPQRNVSAFN